MRRHDSLSGALATRAWFAAGERAYGSSVLLLCLAALLALSVLVAIGIGPVQIAPAVTWKILSSHVLRLLTGHESTGGWSGGQDTIVWLIRFPRVILGGLVGAGLALVGAVLQAVTRNSLADLLLLRGDLAEAKSVAETNIARTSRLLDDHPELWYLHAILMNANRTLAAALRRSGQRGAAFQVEQAAEEHRRDLRAARDGAGPVR